MRFRTAVACSIGLALALLLPATVAAENPYTADDGTWITLEGTVQSVSPDRFELDWKGTMVTIEMDDGDRDADAYKLLEGDDVTVTGRVDDDLFESTTIEASSVYVEKLGTYFHSSAVDEEGSVRYYEYGLLDGTDVSVQGTVTGIDLTEFTLDTGLRSITVDVSTLGYDPLDDEGYQRIDVGDMVHVRGTIDDDFFEGRELMATRLTTLVKNFGMTSSSR